MRLEKIHKATKKKKKKETFFYGWTDLPSRIGRSGQFFFFLVSKMTPLENNKISQKADVFWRKILVKEFQLFRKTFSQIFFVFDQKRLVLHRFSKL